LDFVGQLQARSKEQRREKKQAARERKSFQDDDS